MTTYMARCAALIAMLACASLSAIAHAADSKEACLESHSRGQDAREQGKVSLARKLFMACAQSSCPALVQNECARLADELERMQPWLGFSARDSKGNDLPDTAVYVDDVLLVTHLDDGKPHEVDPGRHVVRFQNGTRERVMTVVVGSGEKGRTIVGTFESPADGQSKASDDEPGGKEAEVPPHVRKGRIAMGASAALIVGGATLGVVGLMRVPSKCSLSSHECAAPPGDSSFDQASKAVRLSNVGWTLTGVGVVALTASIVWYLKKSKSTEGDPQVAPWATPESAGLSVLGRM